jgi:vacuolar-type H+-ATPase subunit E/Vma4
MARPSQPPAAKAPSPYTANPAPVPARPPSSPPTAAIQPAGSTEALEAKALSLEQRESMMPRGSIAPLRPLPADILASRGPDTLDLSAMQAAYDSKLQAAMTAFEQAVEDIANLRARILGEAEETVVTLAAALARRVIGREITLDPEIMMTLAAEGTEALGERDRVMIRLAPFEHDQAWTSFEERLRRRVPRCEIIQDPSLSFGQCVVESELGRVDESVDSRLATVLKAILPETEEGGA